MVFKRDLRQWILLDYFKLIKKWIECRLIYIYTDILDLKLLYLNFLARFNEVLWFEAGEGFNLRVFTFPQKWVWLVGWIYNTEGPAELKYTHYHHSYNNKMSIMITRYIQLIYHLQMDVPTPVEVNSITLVLGSRVDPWGLRSSRFCLVSVRYPESCRWKWQ